MATPEVKVKISAVDASKAVLASVQRNTDTLRRGFLEAGTAGVQAASGTGIWEAGLQKLSIQQVQSTNYTNRWTAGLRALQVQQAATTAGTVMAGSAAVRGVEGYKKFGNALTNVGLRMVGVSGQAGRLAEGVLLMGLGGPVTLAVAAGLAIIGAGYMLLTKRTREAREEQEKLNDEYDRFIETQNPVLQHTAAATVFAQQAQALDAKIAQLRSTQGRSVDELVGGPDGMLISRKIDNTKEITRLEAERTRVLERLKAAEIEANKAFNEGLPPKPRKPPKGPKPEIFDNTAPLGDGNTLGGRAASGALWGTAAEVALGILGGRRSAGGPNTNGKSPLREALEQEAAEALATLREIRGQLAQGIADSIGDGLANGFAAALGRGGIKAGFKALISSLLTGIGNAMVTFGKASLAASTFMLKIKTALASLNPAAGIAASIAMIAIGGALAGAASSAFGGGGASSGYSARGQTDTVTRVTVSPTPASQSTASLKAVQPITQQFTIIGPNDPTAQRLISELANNGARRGLKFGQG